MFFVENLQIFDRQASVSLLILNKPQKVTSALNKIHAQQKCCTIVVETRRNDKAIKTINTFFYISKDEIK